MTSYEKYAMEYERWLLKCYDLQFTVRDYGGQPDPEQSPYYWGWEDDE